jgi:hypothetical protein
MAGYCFRGTRELQQGHHLFFIVLLFLSTPLTARHKIKLRKLTEQINVSSNITPLVEHFAHILNITV